MKLKRCFKASDQDQNNPQAKQRWSLNGKEPIYLLFVVRAQSTRRPVAGLTKNRGRQSGDAKETKGGMPRKMRSTDGMVENPQALK